MIIDSHAHMDELVALGWIDPPEKVVGIMDKAGIDKAVVSTYCNLPGINPDALDYVAEGINKYPDRLYAYVRLDPWYGKEAVKIFEKAVKDYGFKGVKFHPVHYTLHPYGEQTVDILKKAAEMDVPALFHCSDEAMSLPLQIGLAAEKVPEAKIIMAHSGGFYHYRDAINIARRCPNVYLDTCEMPFPAVIKKSVQEIGAERVLFGTDIPTDNAKLEIDKIKLAGLTQEEEELIYWQNIAKLIKLDI